MKKHSTILVLMSLASLLVSACGFFVDPQEEENAIATAIAMTVVAMNAQQPTAIPVQPTNTLAPAATITAQPTATAYHAPTVTPRSCNQVAFVSEYPLDGVTFKPGETFTKRWRFKNTGTCTWNSSYAVVFTSGNNAMGAPAAKQLTTDTVAPGQTVVISMDLTTPALVGNYKAEFKLRNANGVIFGFGADNRSFWVQIDVVVSTYNFATNACSAVWTSNVGTLPCPGTLGNINGYILVDAAPKLESGYQDNEPAIWIGAPDQVDSWIKGVFPAVTVTQGMYFQTILGCHPDATNCNVHVRLNYKADGGPEQNLLLWTETNDGNFKKIKSDISSLAGKSVQFIFIVEAYGNPDDDLVHWFMPVVGP